MQHPISKMLAILTTLSKEEAENYILLAVVIAIIVGNTISLVSAMLAGQIDLIIMWSVFIGVGFYLASKWHYYQKLFSQKRKDNQ